MNVKKVLSLALISEFLIYNKVQAAPVVVPHVSVPVTPHVSTPVVTPHVSEPVVTPHVSTPTETVTPKPVTPVVVPHVQNETTNNQSNASDNTEYSSSKVDRGAVGVVVLICFLVAVGIGILILKFLL